MITLLCTVRGCGRPLAGEGRALRCETGHAFDRARSGYTNLLQPQDRRSATPGDTKEAVLARRRLFDGGYAAVLSDALRAAVVRLGDAARVLDVGCGEGTHLGRLASLPRIERSGIDISANAIGLAARRYPNVTWVVANADRMLPYPDASFDLVASITGRRNPPEFARVLRPEGRVFVAVPAPDDLVELRAAVQGESRERSRIESMEKEMDALFALDSVTEIRERQTLEREPLIDLLHATYRGMRRSSQARVEALDAIDVTFAWDVLEFRGKTSSQ